MCISIKIFINKLLIFRGTGGTMSDNNIKILEENNTHLWFENAPMILCSSRVFLDPDQGGLFACAKFLNIQPDC